MWITAHFTVTKEEARFLKQKNSLNTWQLEEDKYGENIRSQHGGNKDDKQCYVAETFWPLKHHSGLERKRWEYWKKGGVIEEKVGLLWKRGGVTGEKAELLEKGGVTVERGRVTGKKVGYCGKRVGLLGEKAGVTNR